MKVWGMTAVAALVLGSFAANSFAADNVAPTKAELEDMYNAAYRAFDSKNFPEALKQLDAIDARQPDLAASKNLRGVILMRQGNYDQAESALQEAARIDPKFWNARFNLAEIPFLKKDWAEARKRFEQLLSSGESDLAKEASQLIQYKILLTYLLEGNGNMVDSILAKLELSSDTPAVNYVKAAVALQQKNEKEAKDWISAAEKNFSPQLNKLFAESLYEVGWLEKPAGAARPSLPLMTAAERSEKTKAIARSKFEQAQQALRQRDFATALKLVGEADQADPNQPATLNLRGEILMQQQQFDQAEAAFKKAAKLDPKLSEAQFNLAQIPFKKKDYAKARERFETLYKRTPGGDKNQAAELIKFRIYLTLLLEGKESRAHAMMEEFQFTGDTPALYYAQAAWEYKHNNAEKAAEWTTSANKIYSAALNNIFADPFMTSVGCNVRRRVFAANKQNESSQGETLTLAPAAGGTNSGIETGNAEEAAKQQPTGSVSSETAAETPSQSQQAATESSPAGGESTTTAQPAAGETPNAVSAANTESNQQAPVETSPSEKPTVVVPAKVSIFSVAGIASKRLWIVAGLLLTAIVILAWVIIPVVRRHAFSVPRHLRVEPPPGAAEGSVAVFKPPTVAPAKTSSVQGNGFVGGPRQVSLELKPWNPPLRHAAKPTGRKPAGAFDRLKDRRGKAPRAPAYREPDRESAPPVEPAFDESCVGPVVEQTPEVLEPAVFPSTEVITGRAGSEFADLSATETKEPNEIFEGAQEATVFEQASNEFSGDGRETALIEQAPSETFAGTEVTWGEVETSPQFAVEAISQEQPQEIFADANQFPTEEATTEPVPDFPSATFTEPVFPQITTPETMPETTQTPIAPVNKAPAPTVAKPQPPPAGTQTSVQITFSFEIAAMQLTPSFKMGVLKVRPLSKLVTMRLPSPQRAQSALNLQVAFEVLRIQPVAGALGTIRVVPSQQQRPTMTGMPSFAVAGLQLVPNSETAPVQLTPSPQGRAAVFITVPFQISTLEFSPSLEIASVILNSNSKQVIVQLPGAGPGPAEGAPMFEIANLELNEGGEIVMMQLNLLGGPKRA